MVRFIVDATRLERLARGGATIGQEIGVLEGRRTNPEAVKKREEVTDSEPLAAITAAPLDSGIGLSSNNDGGSGVLGAA